MSLTYNSPNWASTLRNNIRSSHHLHTHNPNYISKPPLEIYSTQSKKYYNPKQSIDRDIVWRSSSKKVPIARSQDYVFRSASRKVEEYHKRNSSGNIISHQFVRSREAGKETKPHPAVEKRRQMRAGTYAKDDTLSQSTSIMSMNRKSERPNYMNSKLMKQTLQYEYAPNQEKKTYMPKTLRNR